MYYLRFCAKNVSAKYNVDTLSDTAAGDGMETDGVEWDGLKENYIYYRDFTVLYLLLANRDYNC